MRKKTFLKIAELQTRQSQLHLDEVRSIHQEMRGFKHDFHNHMQTLRGQLEAGQVQRALDYIQELDRQLTQIDTLVKTGNVALDAILSGKIARAKDQHIAFTVKASVPEGLTLTDVELSILVGNLLDNALEACQKTEDAPFIRLYMAMKGKMLYFHMMNSAGAKQQKSGSLFSTRKREGFHGFGLRRAKDILEAHGGWCSFNSEDGAFTSEFLVPAVQ